MDNCASVVGGFEIETMVDFQILVAVEIVVWAEALAMPGRKNWNGGVARRARVIGHRT